MTTELKGKLIFAFLFLCLPSFCWARTRRQVIQDDGVAYDEFSFLLSPEMISEQIEKVTILTEDTSIITWSSATMIDMNISVALEAGNDVGPADFVVIVKTYDRTEPYTFPYTLDVLGISLSDGEGIVLSGDQGTGLTFKDFEDALESKSLIAQAYSGDGNFEDLTQISVQILDESPEGQKVLSETGVVANGDSVVVRPNPFQTGRATIQLEHPGVVLDGEIALTTIDVAVPEEPHPSPYRIPTSEKPMLLNISLPATSVDVMIRNLVGRPDTGPFTMLTGYLNKQPLFAMDAALTNLTETGDQRIVLAYSPDNKTLLAGDYNMTLRAEYTDTTLTVRETAPLLVSVVQSNNNVGSQQNLGGYPANISAVVISAVAGGALVVAALASLVMWRRSVNRSKKAESSYASAGGNHGGSQGSFGDFGSSRRVVGVPNIQSSDSIVRDTYARNDSMYSSSSNEPEPAGSVGSASGPRSREVRFAGSSSTKSVISVREYDFVQSSTHLDMSQGSVNEDDSLRMQSSATGDDSYVHDTSTSSSSLDEYTDASSASRKDLYNLDSETSSWFQRAANAMASERERSDVVYPSSNFSTFL